ELSDICVDSLSSSPAFMVTWTLTTAGVTLAARSEKSRGKASPASAGGAVTRGTIRAGAVSAVVRAKAAKMPEVLLFIGGASSLLAEGIWGSPRGSPMAATLNVSIVIGPLRFQRVRTCAGHFLCPAARLMRLRPLKTWRTVNFECSSRQPAQFEQA